MDLDAVLRRGLFVMLKTRMCLKHWPRKFAFLLFDSVLLPPARSEMLPDFWPTLSLISTTTHLCQSKQFISESSWRYEGQQSDKGVGQLHFSGWDFDQYWEDQACCLNCLYLLLLFFKTTMILHSIWLVSFFSSARRSLNGHTDHVFKSHRP